MILMLLFAAVVFGGIFGYKTFVGIMTGKYMASQGIPASTVSTTVAKNEEWQPKIEAVGNVRAVNGADLAAEIAGIVESLNFESGSTVEKDAVLAQLRADDDIAKLHALEATEKLARLTLERSKKLIASQAISQATYDNDAATLQNAEAAVAQQKATIAKKTIRAPFAGQLGIRQVDVGQYLSSGTPIATLQQLNPIYVDFNIPESSLPQIKVGQKVAARVTSQGNAKLIGNVTAINSKIDEATRNVQVRASFANDETKLLPGMFANIEIEVGQSQKLLTLPQAAISYNPYGNIVYVVDKTDPAKLIAKQVFVVTGSVRGDQVSVTQGIKEGDEVVTSGQMKLRQGSPIKVNNEITPKNDADPKPVDK